MIVNEVRDHIQGMPRGLRKQVVIEEMISFLKATKGAEIVIGYYERMRKHSCQVTSVVLELRYFIRSESQSCENDNQ